MGSANPIAAIASPALGLAGGLISGGKAADAARGQAEALRAAAERASAMAQFKPMGMTTAFGSSQFTPEGQGSYQLSPELRAIQERLFGAAYLPQRTTRQTPQLPEGYSLTDTNPMQARASVMPRSGFQFAYGPSGDRIEVPTVSETIESVGGGGYSPEEFMQQVTPLSGGAASLFNLGQQYLATSPQQAAQDYITNQQALLQPSREADLARVQAANFGRGTGGLGVNTGTGGAPSNPLAQALFNAQGRQDLELAARADEAGMARARFGAGLFGTGGDILGQVPRLTTAGYGPLEAQLGLLRTTETMGQDPFRLSTGLANQYAQAGANAGNLFMQPQAAAANAYSQYQGYSPMGTALSAIGGGMGGMGGGGGGGASSWFSGLFGGGGPQPLGNMGGAGFT